MASSALKWMLRAMVNGIPGVQAMFRRKAAAVVAAGRAAAKKGGEDVGKAMRYLAPEDQLALKKSIRVEDAATRSTSARGEVGFIGVVVKAGDASTVVTNSRGQRFQNAKLQENGTKNMPANPYFNPAWRANRTRVRGAITRAVRRAWAPE